MLLPARPQHRVEQLLQVAPGQVRVGVARGDRLALLGQAQAAADRLRRLREDRAVGGAAAAADRAAAAVEQREPHAVGPAARRQAALREVQLPVGGHVAGVLVGVAVADHHRLPAAALRQVARVGGVPEQPLQGTRGRVQVGDGLEQRHHVEARRRRRRPWPAAAPRARRSARASCSRRRPRSPAGPRARARGAPGAKAPASRSSPG